MEKILKLMLITLIMLAPLTAKAEDTVVDIIKNIPALKQGVAYSLADSNVNYLATIDVAKFKGFSLEIGYAGHAKETGDKLVGVLSYDLFQAKDYIDIPLLKYIEFRPGIWGGVGRIGGSYETDFGLSATVLSLKF